MGADCCNAARDPSCGMKMKHRPEAGVDESGAVLLAGAHTLQLGTQLLALLGKLGIFNDMVIYARPQRVSSEARIESPTRLPLPT